MSARPSTHKAMASSVRTGAKTTLLFAAALASVACDLVSPDARSVSAAWQTPLGGRNGIPNGAHASDSSSLYILAFSDSARIMRIDALTGRIVWRVPLRPGTTLPQKLIADGGQLFEASAGGVVAYRTADGTVQWERKLPERVPGQISTVPAVDEQTIYVADHQGAAWAVDRSDGVVRWRWEDSTGAATRPVIFSVGAVDGTIYLVGRISGANAGGDQGVVIALDPMTGTERHRFVTPETASDYRSVRSDGRGGLLLGNLARSGVDALDPRTWTFRWRVSRPNRVVFPGSDLAVSGNDLFAGWEDIVAIDLATGRERWSRRSRGTTYSTVVCGQQVVSQHFNLSFFDRATGRLEAFNDWQDGQFPTSDLLEDGERVYAISTNFAYAFPCRR